MSWDSEDYKEHRELKQKKKQEILIGRQKEITVLSRKYQIDKLTDYHYRVNNRIDIYPVNKKYYDSNRLKWGVYNNLTKFLEFHIGK